MASLLAFLVLWLFNNYKEYKRQLKRETNYLYVRTIKDVEDSLKFHANLSINDHFFNKVEEGILDVKPQLNRHKLGIVTLTKDSINILDTGLSNYFIRDTHQLDSRAISGSISIFVGKPENIQWTKDKIDTTIIALIKTRFDHLAEDEKFHIPFDVIKSSEASELDQGLTSTTYRDLNTREEYVISLSGFQKHLLAKMVPDLGLAIFLLLLTGLSFYIINQNLLKQENLNILKNDFINNMTHELKTPLTTASIAIEALRDQSSPMDEWKKNEYLDISQGELKRLETLVDKVLNISLWDERTPALTRTSIDMNKLLEQIIDSLKILIDKNKNEVNISSNSGLLLVNGDKIHLFQAIYNVIDNAIKYGGTGTKVDIVLQKIEKGVKISITDNGPGIPIQYQSKIFERFFRVPNKDKHNVKGHGLGLNYVRSIIYQHGGEVHFKSAPETGTNFTLILPA